MKKILQGMALWLDYISYLVFSPFKFKKFPDKINKILVVEELLIGDLIVTLPTLRALKNKFNAQIDILVNPTMNEVAQSLPYANKVISDKESLENYDLGVILHKGSLETSKVLLKKAKYRIGCTKVGLLSPKGHFLNKKIRPNLKEQHKIEDNLDVVRSINVDTTDKTLGLVIDSKLDSKVKELFKENKLAKLKVVIHPGANYKSHEWPKERYKEIIEYLSKNYNASIIITGSKKGEELSNYICSQTKINILNLAGKTTIKEFFAIIKNSNLVISVDTSASHVAAAFNKPIIVIFGDSNSNVWYPYTERRIVLHKGNSTENISIENVINSIDKILKNET